MLRSIIERLFSRSDRSWSRQGRRNGRRSRLVEPLEPRYALTGLPVLSIGDAESIEWTGEIQFLLTLSEPIIRAD